MCMVIGLVWSGAHGCRYASTADVHLCGRACVCVHRFTPHPPHTHSAAYAGWGLSHPRRHGTDAQDVHGTVHTQQRAHWWIYQEKQQPPGVYWDERGWGSWTQVQTLRVHVPRRCINVCVIVHMSSPEFTECAQGRQSHDPKSRATARRKVSYAMTQHPCRHCWHHHHHRSLLASSPLVIVRIAIATINNDTIEMTFIKHNRCCNQGQDASGHGVSQCNQVEQHPLAVSDHLKGLCPQVLNVCADAFPSLRADVFHGSVLCSTVCRLHFGRF